MDTYFVASGGNDGNGGTAWDDAWATVVFGTSQMAGGGNILVVGSDVDESMSGATITGENPSTGPPEIVISAVDQGTGTAIVYSGAATAGTGARLQYTADMLIGQCPIVDSVSF